jgi:hypothetical protein
VHLIKFENQNQIWIWIQNGNTKYKGKKENKEEKTLGPVPTPPAQLAGLCSAQLHTWRSSVTPLRRGPLPDWAHPSALYPPPPFLSGPAN